ncbi:MAG: 4a-hydroxytetrahydrobiopterin dehydratase [Beijerinckiaceae bacterium]|nr:4a-hydroxytetrahydrobiopterin dehydratase [Beijerinckiaceae bacterium]
MTPEALLDDAITQSLTRDLPHWRLEGNALRRLYRVNGFRSALLVANAIGHLAETTWHHPDLSISWGKVEVSLWSHDAGGVTQRDLALAQRIEEMIAWRPANSPFEGSAASGENAYVLPD